MTVDSIPITKEADFPTISAMTDEPVYLEKAYYHIVYVSLILNNYDSVDRKEEKAEMETYLYE